MQNFLRILVRKELKSIQNLSIKSINMVIYIQILLRAYFPPFRKFKKTMESSDYLALINLTSHTARGIKSTIKRLFSESLPDSREIRSITEAFCNLKKKIIIVFNWRLQSLRQEILKGNCQKTAKFKYSRTWNQNNNIYL